MEKSENNVIEFHAVEFMRQVRNELSELYMLDKKKYLNNIKTVMDDFLALRKSLTEVK